MTSIPIGTRVRICVGRKSKLGTVRGVCYSNTAAYRYPRILVLVDGALKLNSYLPNSLQLMEPTNGDPE